MFSKADGKKIRKTFPTRAAAAAWRDDSRSAVRNRTLRAPTSTTLKQAADAWVEGARSGLIRPRSGATVQACRGQALRAWIAPARAPGARPPPSV